MTMPRYKIRKSMELTIIWAAAAAQPAVTKNDPVARMITAETVPASSEARTYLQTAAITVKTLNWIGLPAYQNAGRVKTQKETVHARAIPTDPQWSPAMNSKTVTVNSTIPQRSQRSARPTDK